MKRIIYFFMLMEINVVSVCAHDIAVANSNGKVIYYNKLTNTVEVTYRGNSWGEYTNEYTGVIVIPETVTYMNKVYTVKTVYYSAFCACSNLTAVTIPKSVTDIGPDAFKACTSLGVVNLSKGLKKIGSGAFSNCSRLNYIIIPDGVTDIGSKSFYGCSSLTSIYSYSESPNAFESDAFDNSTYNSATLFVPFGAKDAYKSTDGWKNFKNIVEMESTAVQNINSTDNIVNIICINGKVVSKPQKGINVIKYNDGTVKKVLNN